MPIVRIEMDISFVTPEKKEVLNSVMQITFETVDGQQTLYDHPMDVLVEICEGNVIINKDRLFKVTDGLFYIAQNTGVFSVSDFFEIKK